jgi:hypothetical protein
LCIEVVLELGAKASEVHVWPGATFRAKANPSIDPVIGMVWSDLVLVWSRPPRVGLV